MNKTFCLLVAPSRKLGHVFMPYIIEKTKSSEYYQPTQLVTEDNYQQLTHEHEHAYVKELLKLISYYDEANLLKLFSKKKLTPKAFFEKMDNELFEKHIRPYIEKQLAKCIGIAREHKVCIYRREERANLYPEDRITYASERSETVFCFTKNEAGLSYSLEVASGEESISLFDKYYVLLSNEPCHIIIGDQLYHFPGIDGKKLKPFFDKKTIQIPESFHSKYFEGFIYNCIKKYRVHAEGFAIEEKRLTPVPLLCIENDLQQNACLQLYFSYNGKQYLFSNRAPFTVDFITEPEYKYIKHYRETEYETDVVDQLKFLGLKLDDYGFLVPKSGCAITEWVSENRQELLDYNIEVTNLEKAKIDLQTASISLTVKDNKDWFDVDAVVMFGDQQVPFKQIRKLIAQEKNELLLPNGNIAIIPPEWFAQYAQLVKIGKDAGDGLQINAVHAGLIPKDKMEFADKATFDKIAELQQLDTETADLPKIINAELRPYQKQGFQWMYQRYKHHLGACLADDMGLGKTLQTLTLLAKAGEEQEGSKPIVQPGAQLSLFDAPDISETYGGKANLIVVPASLKHNWYSEILKFLPKSKVYIYQGANRIPIEQFNSYQFIIITYGLLRNVIDEFEKYEFLYAVLDESQAIKNPDSKIYKTVLRLESRFRLALTGTPIENNLNDLWAQMNFLNHGMLGNQSFFKNTFVKPIEQRSEVEQDMLRQMVSPFILRRSKQEVAPDLPEITRQYIYCSMDEEQSALYEEEKSKARNLIYDRLETGGDGENHSFQVLQAIMALRQIANHPVLFNAKSEVASGKFATVCKSLETVLKEKHKVLVFSSFVKHLELYENYLNEQGIKYEMLTGKTADRKGAVDRFQENEDCQVFLISLKAGGTGLNLTAADYVFMLDPWWNPAAEEQAISRAHRIGQTQPVFVYRFISEASIEEKIIILQEKKSQLADVFVNNNASSLRMEDLKLILQ